MSEERSTAVAKVVEPERKNMILSDVIKTPQDSKALHALLGMLGSCRPHDTKSTLDFAKKWLKPLGAKIDARGNWRLKIGESKVLWSSHIDTVDWHEGPKSLVLNHDSGVIRLSDKGNAGVSCLGADCTTGVWIMREMALAKVPGLYIWHEAEESGGQGSSWIESKDPDTLKGIDAAIAFDRKGFGDIITRQAGGMCCSDEFARALAHQLPDTGFKPDPTGTFTDTANYTDIVPECTNLSVGYFSQHGKSETQNAIFAIMMRNAMVRFDEAMLVIKRKPGEGKEVYGRYSSVYYGGNWGWDDYGYAADKPRQYVLVGDDVRILAGAARGGMAAKAFVTDIGRVGQVTMVTYSSPVTVNVLFPNGDKIAGLERIYVERVIPEQKKASEVGTVGYYVAGDIVKIRDTACAAALDKSGNTLETTRGKQGRVISKAGRLLDIKLDNGKMVWQLDQSHIQLIKAAPLPAKKDTQPAHGKVSPINKPKDYSKTKCGGLCEGKCQGFCSDPKKLERLKGIAAALAKAKANTAEEEDRDTTFGREPKVTVREENGRKIKVYDYGDDELLPRECVSILEFIKRYPDQIVDLIEQWGLTIDDLYDAYPDSL